MRVHLTRLPHDPLVVGQLTHLARDVARWFGSPRWGRPVHLITDDLADVRRLITGHTEFHPDRFHGYYWCREGVIWVSPRLGVEHSVATLTHEVTHAVTTVQHDRTWRRVFVSLLPLFETTLLPLSVPITRVESTALVIIERYRTRDVRADYSIGMRHRVQHEVDSCARDARRCWDTWSSRLPSVGGVRRAHHL